MQINAVQPNQNINSKYNQLSFRAKSIDGAYVSNELKNLWLKETTSELNSKYSIFDKFYKTFKDMGQINIKSSFMSCLNSDGSVSKNAIRMLYAFCGLKSPYFLDRVLQLFSKKEISKSYVYKSARYNENLKNAADVIDACKNKDGYHVRENLLIAEEMRNKMYDRDFTVQVINAFKDKNGVITKENREFYDYIRQNYPQNFGRLIRILPDKNNNVSESVKNFVIGLNGSTVVNSGRFKQSDYIIDVLEHTQNLGNRDEILDFILNSEYLRKECPSIRYYTDKDRNINLDYLKKYLEISGREDIQGFKASAYIYHSDSKEILDKNIEQLKRFNKYYENDAIEKFAESKYFKKDGVISKEFVDFIVENDYMFMNRDSYNAYPFIDTSLDFAVQKDGSINYEVASILLKTGYKYSQKIDCHGRYNPDKIKNILMKISELCKDADGNFNKENIIKIIKDTKYIQENFWSYYDNGINKEIEIYLNEKYMSHITKDKNLYDSKVILDILNKGINYDILTTKIPEYENLLFAIADIPPNNNPAAYKEIINKLYSIKTANYNIKDSHGISLLEKVLNSENKELLEVISHPSNTPLEYYPELDFAYQGIQDREFKKQVDNELHIRFPLIEEAVELQSPTALEKVEQQLDSPLCHKKEVLNKLWNIALKSHNREFCNYFALRFAKELPDSIINDLNKM